MAKDDDKYKEGTDFEWVQGNGGFKTRKFFTKKEKQERALAPKTSAMPPVRPKAKPKLKGITTVPITTSKLPPAPGEAPSAIKHYQDMLKNGNLTPSVERTIRETLDRLDAQNKKKDTSGGPMPSVDAMGNATGMKRGGKVSMKEGSAKDMREDKMKAKKAGMSMKTWEKSAADKKHDAPKKMATGGVVKKASGGSMRGTGAAVRGKGFSGCY